MTPSGKVDPYYKNYINVNNLAYVAKLEHHVAKCSSVEDCKVKLGFPNPKFDGEVTFDGVTRGEDEMMADLRRIPMGKFPTKMMVTCVHHMPCKFGATPELIDVHQTQCVVALTRDGWMQKMYHEFFFSSLVIPKKQYVYKKNLDTNSASSQP